MKTLITLLLLLTLASPASAQWAQPDLQRQQMLEQQRQQTVIQQQMLDQMRQQQLNEMMYQQQQEQLCPRQPFNSFINGFERGQRMWGGR